MKVIILAAGKGNRLKGLLNQTPKPMIEYYGKPLLQHNIELCKSNGITDIYINTHHLGNVIEDFFGNGNKFGVNITYSKEKNLLGTSGAVRKIAYDFWGGKDKVVEPFFVIYGDNYIKLKLNYLKAKSNRVQSIAIIAFHYREDTSQSGVAEFSKNNRIIKFIEKPKAGTTNSHWVNAAVYYLTPEIFNYIPCGFSDFAKDVFPSMLEQGIPIYGLKTNIDLKAFDTPEMFKKSFRKV